MGSDPLSRNRTHRVTSVPFRERGPTPFFLVLCEVFLSEPSPILMRWGIRLMFGCSCAKYLRCRPDRLSGHARLLLAGLLDRFVDTEAGRSLTWRKILEGLEEFTNQNLSRHEQEHTIGGPFVIEHGSVFVSLL